MSFYNKFTGINDLPQEAQGMMRTYGLIRALWSSIASLTGTFLILYVIDSVGFKEASIITSILFLTQLLIDYPSGSLGDYIGQKWVISIALICNIVGYYLLSLTTNYSGFVVVAIILGIGNAQASGALQSWLDNSYKGIDSSSDPERKNYGYTMTRFGTIDTATIGISIFLGGVFATTVGRGTMFFWQAGLYLFLLVIVIIFLGDKHSAIEAQLAEVKKGNYVEVMKNGIKFAFSSKKMAYFILGVAIFQVCWAIWGNLLLFPIYFGYSGSDSLAGVLRSVIFFLGVVIQIFVAQLTKRISNGKLPAIVLGQALALFLTIAALLYFLPVQNSFSVVGFALLIVVMTITVSVPMPFINAIFGRILLDLIPSENRTGIYSLMPTISGMFTIPLLPFTGSLIESTGMIPAVLLALGIAIIASLLIYLSWNAMSQEQELVVQKKLANETVAVPA